MQYQRGPARRLAIEERGEWGALRWTSSILHNCRLGLLLLRPSGTACARRDAGPAAVWPPYEGMADKRQECDVQIDFCPWGRRHTRRGKRQHQERRRLKVTSGGARGTVPGWQQNLWPWGTQKRGI